MFIAESGPKWYQVKESSSSKHEAHCQPCKKDIDVAQMGESALQSHAKGDGHKKHEKLMS